MLRFAANISTMCTEVADIERIAAARKFGFDHVEWLFPYHLDLAQIRSQLLKYDVQLILMNTALGDPKSGEKGIGALSHRIDAFKSDIDKALDWASELEVLYLHVMAGIVPERESREKYLDTFCENLDWACDKAAATNTRLLIEPLNTIDSPGYLHSTTEQALEIIERVQHRVGLQYDFYHLQLMEGNLGNTIKQQLPHIEHIQFSSVPGRHEPQYGEVNVYHLFDLLEELGYSGFVGCEYTPKTTTAEGLAWFQEYRSRVNTNYLDG